MRLEEVKQAIKELLAETYAPGNGGYVADFGPHTYMVLKKFVQTDEDDEE